MKSFSTVDFNKRVGEVIEAALKEPVFITRRKKPKFVLMTIEDYERADLKTSSGSLLR